MTVQVGDYVRATYDFPGEAAADLSFTIGDLVKVTDVVDANWAVGQKVGSNQSGTFPQSFVEHLTLPSARTGQKVFLATDNFPADQNGDLELTKGDIVLGLEPVNESWWRGKIGPLKGIFPLTMVAELELNDGLRSRSASACSSGLRLRSDSVTSYGVEGNSSGITKVTETTFARALVDIKPQLDGELGFQLGDLIEITKIVDDDWFYGKCHNKEGLVSAVCVELLIEDNKVNDGLANKFQMGRPMYSLGQLLLHEPSSGADPQIVESRTGNGSYTSENTRSHDAEITPYGRVIYPFTAQIPTELSLSENSLVTLIKHVDSDWTEGEVDGRQGLFPTSFIEIIVDCPYAYSQDLKDEKSSTDLQSGVKNTDNNTAEVISNTETAANSSSSSIRVNGYSRSLSEASVETYSRNKYPYASVGSELPEENHEIGLVLYDFVAEVKGDVSVKEGDTVEVMRKLNENWLQIQIEDGQVGQVPRNHIEIIGPWPKVKSKPHGLKSSVSINVEFTENFQEESNTSSWTGNTGDVLASTPGSSNESVIEKKHLTPSQKPIIPPKAKPPIHPKPALTPKPTVPLKPASVLSPHPFTLNRHSFSNKSKTNVPIMENRTNSLSALNDFIKEEMTKAKGGNLYDHSVTALNSDLPTSAPSDISTEDPTKLSDVSPVSIRGGCVIDNNSDSLHKSSPQSVSYSSKNTASTTQPAASPEDVRSLSRETKERRSKFANSMSFAEGSSTNSNADSRRKSTSFFEHSTYKSGVLTDSNFVNKAFQMDVPEAILVDVNNKKTPPPHHCPVRPAPPRPVNAVVASLSQTVQASQSKIKQAPPRPTGPRIASAPSKTPLMPSRVETPVRLIPRRSAPRAPDVTNQNNNFTAHGSTPLSSQQHAPRPSSLRPAPKRPPPRPVDLMSFSPDGSVPAPSGEDNRELVADLKSKLEENQADIKKFEQTKSDLEKSLAQADNQEKKAETTDNLEFVERQLCGLWEEEGRLKENLFALSPHEARLEKARLLSAQQAEEDRKRKEEEKKREAEMKEKRRDQRTKVIEEILDTEKDFLFSLQMCLETFLDGQKPPAGVELSFLLGNMEEIADVSQKMVVHLESCISGKSFEEQYVGKCFTRFAEDMKNTYAPYCRNHDDVIAAMERYTENTEINDYCNVKIEKMREQMNVFDVAGVLIKPVQRILKYPLLLNELLKNTEDGHPDKEDIVAAISAMTDVARAINEYKRRKDLVYKYKKFTDQTFTDKISKLNFHSIRKKSSRIKGRLTTNFGIALQMKDEHFEKEEAKFRHLERAVKVFLRGVIQFLDQSQETMQIQETVVDGICKFHHDKECEETAKLKKVTLKLLELFDNMKETLENLVIASLSKLVGLFTGPAKVIEKRFDKLLDYNYQLGRTENDKELQAAKIDYEAMNAQLLDELPKFCNLAFKTLKNCVAAFILARRDFMDLSLKECCSLLELPSMASKSALMETFQTRHIIVFDQLSLLSFIPKGFNPRVDTIKADRAKLKSRSQADGGQPQQNTSSQTEKQKLYLHQLYPISKLYTMTSTHNAVEPIDISLAEGTLVGVIKDLDPMGGKDHWFVDDGATKGFVPCSLLEPLGSVSKESTSNPVIEEDLISILSSEVGDVILSGNVDRVKYYVRDLPNESTSLLQPETQQQYYYALYDFISRHANETSLVAGHPVTVLAFHDVDGNSEWWLVESEGNCGYAPANYMAPMPYS